MPGFSRGLNLDKMGMHVQDTSELFFADSSCPGLTCSAHSETGAFEQTLAYCKEWQAFGRPIGSCQHSRFELAELATELELVRAVTDKAIMAHVAGELTAQEAAMVKWWDIDLCNRACDRCVPLHGGYGYMRDTRRSSDTGSGV